jgi:hypothetical protein
MGKLVALFLALLLAYPSAAAQPIPASLERPARPTMATLPDWARTPVRAPRRALVVGIGQYQTAPDLSAPRFDADRVANLLGANQFAVRRLASDAPSYLEIVAAVQTFAASVQVNDIVIVYFSGHGMMREGENFLIPSDAIAPVAGAAFSGDYIPLSWVMDQLRKRNPASLFLILDACRYDPFADVPPGANPSTLYERVWPNDVTPIRGGLDDLAGIGAHAVGLSAGKNQIAYSYAAGDRPEDGSIYTRTLVQNLEQEATLNDALNAASNFVGRLTSDRVRPVVLGAGAPNFAVVRSAHDDAEQQRRWLNVHARIRSTGNELQELLAYVDNSGAHDYAGPARSRIAEITGQRLTASGAAPTRASPPGVTLIQRAGAILAGALRFSSVGSDGMSDFAVTSRPVQLVHKRALGFLPRIIGDPLARDQVVAELPAGQELQIVGLNADRNWAQVMLPDGQLGTVRNVRLLERAPQQRIELTYNGDTPLPGAQLNALTGLTHMNVRIVVGFGGDAVSAAHGADIGYGRGQRLALALEDLGAEPTRVRVEISNAAALQDRAVVEVIAP